MEEVIGAAAVEALFGVRREAVAATASRGSHQIGATIENGVQLLAIPGGNVFDVVEPLESPFNLEGADPRLDQGLQVVCLIHILERQQVAVGHQHFTVRLLQRAGQTAELGTLATVGAAAGTGMADIALAAVGDTERAVDKELQLHIGRRADLADLRKRQFARQHHLRETHILQKLHLLRRAVVGLGTGMKRDGWQIQRQQPHILHDERICSCFIDLVGQPPGLLQLMIVQQGVEGDKDLGAETVGVARQRLDILDGVARRTAGAKGRPPHVDGIGTMVDGFDAVGEVLGRSQQLQPVVVT